MEQQYPKIEDEKLLNSIIENKPSFIPIAGTKKKYKIFWLKGFTRRKITDIMLNEGEDEKDYCKVAAAIILNDYWKLKFKHWFLWRWFYYVRQYTEDQLLPVIMEGQKKNPQEAYLTLTILSIGMKDTMMKMTKDEANRFLQGRSGEKVLQSEKSTNG